MYDRRALKRSAKEKLFTGNPAVWIVCLVFILTTTWVSELADAIVPSPVTTATEMAEEWMSGIDEDAVVSESELNSLTKQIQACFSGTGATIGLFLAVLIGLYQMVVNYGFCSYALKTMRGRERGGVKEIYSHFYLAGKIILCEVLQMIFIYFWSMLFVIPGLIASYRYRLAPYLLLDDPNISALEAIRRSKRLMAGAKANLFITDISFWGWGILVAAGAYVVGTAAYAVTGSDMVYYWFYLAGDTAGSMFLLAYQNLTWAGFYEMRLQQAAPPVNNMTGREDRSFRSPWDHSDDDDDAWNR